MLWPTEPQSLPARPAYPPLTRWVPDVPAYRTAEPPRSPPHTHLVRGGSLMFQPTRRHSAPLLSRIPTSSEVGPLCSSLLTLGKPSPQPS